MSGTSLVTLDEREQNFAVLLAEGKAISEAGAAVGLSQSAAYVWAKKPQVREYAQQVQAEVRNRLVRKLFGLADAAIELQAAALEGRAEVTPTQAKVADSVLDRIGVSREQIVKHIGSADEPIVIEFNVPVNRDARAEQEERRRRRAEAQDKIVEASFRPAGT